MPARHIGKAPGEAEWARCLLLPVASAAQERISLSPSAAEGRVARLRTPLRPATVGGVINPTLNLFFASQPPKHPLALSF